MTSSDAELIVGSVDTPSEFGEIFDRHSQAIYQYLRRRVGAQEAEPILGDVFLAAFEHRGRFDPVRRTALPWLYGIAANLSRRAIRDQTAHRAILATIIDDETWDDPTAAMAAGLDARDRWKRTVEVISTLPAVEQEALLLFAWEELSYDEIATVLNVPVGTVRSRLNRARRRLRDTIDDLELVRGLRPGTLPAASPTVLATQKERLMQAIDWNRPGSEDILRPPDVHPRLAYRDERAALEHLVRVFGFEEVRDARTDLGDSILAFLRMGNGLFMIGREDPDTHRIHSPAALGGSTVQMQIRVTDIDAQYQHAMAEGADITMPLEDAFYGERRYEANDLEGHRWHFSETFADIRARGGDAPGYAQ